MRIGVNQARGMRTALGSPQRYVAPGRRRLSNNGFVSTTTANRLREAQAVSSLRM
ncbi:Protein of unknown function [Micromonospora lupini str. Lupac 08]|uniref:Uncharacterized protein n=1 Tax=Micromonospora lupini str. Lupac 08 TaxID=1150864 RepID=I0L7K8_9ACTN|nr:Protein of unknown function [Micromonospora lupini str. Lupac 08]